MAGAFSSAFSSAFDVAVGGNRRRRVLIVEIARMLWAKQSTAATVIVGPILDSTGAEYTGAVIGDLSLSKNGGTLTALASAATLTHIANGQYTLVLTTGNTDTLGRAQILVNKSTYQMPPLELMVLPATVFDALVTNAANTTGGLIAATAAVSAAAGYLGSTGAAVNGTNVNTLAGHDPGTTLGTSTLTQAQVTGGAYALNSASFAFDAGLDFTTTQKAATLARVTLVDTATTLTNAPADSSGTTTLLGRLTSTRAGYLDRLAILVPVVSGVVVDDLSNDLSTFHTNMTEGDDYWNDAILVFISGALAGQPRPVTDFTSSGGVFLLSEPFTQPPSAGDQFAIVAAHVHPTTQIAAAVRSELTTELGRIDTTVSSRSSHAAADVVTALGTGSTLTTLATAASITSLQSHGDSAWATATGFATVNPDNASIAAILEDTGTTIPAQIAGLSIPTATVIADTVLRRTMPNVEASASGDTLGLSSLYGLVQSVQSTDTTTHAGKQTVFKTTGAELGQLDLTSDPDAEPITAVG